MKYSDFEQVISPERMRRYLIACHNDSRKAMTLYRYNLKLSQEMFTIISYFEVVLRNKIDTEMKNHYGNHWLRDSIMSDGIFDYDNRVEGTKKIITKAYNSLRHAHKYTHSNLLTEMDFGIWKFMFNNVQYRLSGRCLLNIFPNKPTSNINAKYNNVYVFNELDCVNEIRNRIAHHEPICFGKHENIDTQRVAHCYYSMAKLFQWMNINSESLLYGLDHVKKVLDTIKKI